MLKEKVAGVGILAFHHIAEGDFGFELFWSE